MDTSNYNPTFFTLTTPCVGSPPGDFNADGVFEIQDLDTLIAAIASGLHPAAFDLNGDNLVNLLDRDLWQGLAGETNLGPGRAYRLADANLDGVVDGLDFSTWNANKFTAIAAWSRGDFNADGIVDGLDFSLWNAHKFTSADNSPRPDLRMDQNSGWRSVSIGNDSKLPIRQLRQHDEQGISDVLNLS